MFGTIARKVFGRSRGDSTAQPQAQPSPSLKVDGVDASVHQLHQILQAQDYKPFLFQHAADAFMTSVSAVSGGVNAQHFNVGKQTQEKPLKFYLVSHVILGDVGNLENHYVVGMEASAEDIDNETAALFPHYMGLRDFLTNLSDADIKEFFDKQPRPTQDNYHVQFISKGLRPQ